MLRSDIVALAQVMSPSSSVEAHPLTPPAEAARVLHQMLREKRGETKSLFDMIATLVSTLDLEELLRYVLLLCQELTGCQGVLFYLWDEDRERLVVRAGVEGYEQWVGRFTLTLGEGLTGWTALTRQPGIIRDNPRADPRFRFVPELRDDRFQSYLTVPVEGPKQQLIGVVTMHTVAPHEFTDDDLTVMHTLSALIGAAVENATLYEQQSRQVRILSALAEASRATVQTSSLPLILHRIAATSGGLVGADQCAVMTLDESATHLVLDAGWSTEAESGRGLPTALAADGTWSRLLGATSPIALSRREHREAFHAFDTIAPNARTALLAPMRVADSSLGMLVCFKKQGGTFGSGDRELLWTVASQAALAVQNARLIEALTERNLVRDFFEALLLADESDVGLQARGHRLGVDLDRPHVVVAFEFSSQHAGADSERVWISMRQDLAGRFPSSLFAHRDHTMTGLLRLSDATFLHRLADRLQDAKSEHERPPDQRISAGISRLCHGLSDYPAGFEQARQALLIGKATRGPGSAVMFDELGAQWHLFNVAQDQVRDVFQERLEKLLQHDTEKGTQLFRTVEVYLECFGNSTLAAERLFVHRNTLRQRFDKIRQLVGFDLPGDERWFDLMIAVRIIRLRELSR